MNNYRHPGDICTFTAPYAVASGAGFLVGSIFAVATNAAANGATVEGRVTGVVTLPRATGAGTNWAPGTKIYWDDANKVITKTAGGNTLIGIGLGTAAVGDATGIVRLNGSFS